MLLLSAVVDGLKYNESHEWAKVDGGTATVGLSDFAQVIVMQAATRACCRTNNGIRIKLPNLILQEELGDIVYVELPEVGSEVKHKEQFGVVESVKAGISSALMLAATPACTAVDRVSMTCTYCNKNTGAQRGTSLLRLRGCIFGIFNHCGCSCRLPAMCTRPSVVRSQRSTQHSRTTRQRLVSASC